MRPGQNNNSNNNKNRSRGRNNNGGRKHLNPLSRNYESNGPDVKVRGNAAHIAEKYVQLARDAHASGDSVMAENYLQHAEHYYRIVSAAQPQPRTDQFGQDIPVEEVDDDEFGGDEQSRFDTPQFRAQLQNDRPYQDDRQQQPQGERQPQQGERQQQPQQQGERQFNRDDRPQRDDRQPRFEPQRNAEQPRVDAPAAVQTAEGSPEAAPQETQQAEPGAEGEARRVRERRPRRRRPQLAEGGPVDPAGPQPDVGDLPAFITAGGNNPAE